MLLVMRTNVDGASNTVAKSFAQSLIRLIGARLTQTIGTVCQLKEFFVQTNRFLELARVLLVCQTEPIAILFVVFVYDIQKETPSLALALDYARPMQTT